MRWLLDLLILSFLFMGGPSFAAEGETLIYGKDRSLKYRVKDGKIYDADWELKGYFKGHIKSDGWVYGKDWNLRYRLQKGGSIYDSKWRPKGYVQGDKIFDKYWRLKGRIKRR